MQPMFESFKDFLQMGLPFRLLAVAQGHSRFAFSTLP
jgi:hypothetical protein